MLSIKTFGALQVCYEGEPLALPASRKTRAMLGYLILSRAPQRRERLCELFWEVPEDPRGALRWSLSKLRRLLNIGGQQRLLTERGRVQLDAGAIALDLDQLQACADQTCADDHGAAPEALVRAWESAAHLLMEDCDLPNHPDFSAWLRHQRNETLRLRIRISRRLALAPDLCVEEADKWAQRWLLDAPFDPHAARQAVMAKRKLGREQDARSLASDLAAAFRGAGLTPPDLTLQVPALATTSADDAVEETTAPPQTIRFVHADDRTALAWSRAGAISSPPLLKAANWLSDLELDWEAPHCSSLFEDLARTFSLVRYDARGCGLSDWNVPEISFDALVGDLEAVADAAQLERFALLGIGQSACVSIEYAVRHPERVSHLILLGGYAAGWRLTASEGDQREREAIMVLAKAGWGHPNPAGSNIFSYTFMPDASADEVRLFDEFQRRATSPSNALRFLEVFSRVDVRERLKAVEVPTLVMHSRGDLRCPIAAGHELATRIPNAKFVELAGDHHLLLGHEPASSEFLQAIRRFLGTD